MSQASLDPVSRLIYELSKLPGIGEKTATRLAYHLLKQSTETVASLADALTGAKARTRLCGTCFTFTDEDPCRICQDSSRDHSVICVVERPSDVLSVEQSGAHHGVFHVLHGLLSPLDGVGPDDLKIRDLVTRVGAGGVVQEIVIATNPSVEGEATAMYLARLLKPLGVRVTQLAYGLPVGGALEYTDRQTIGRALKNRVEILSA